MNSSTGNGDDGRKWEVWNLWALDPSADLTRVRAYDAQRRRFTRFEQRALAGIVKGHQTHLAPGRRFLSEYPELRQGIVLTLHLGPYQFLPEPFLAAGIAPVVLLDERAHARLEPAAAHMQKVLKHPVAPRWLPLTAPNFARTLVEAIRGAQPVLVYLDGNVGTGGYRRTRQVGLPYRLPGRVIKVRTGLARLVCRLECPVHPVVVRWTDAGDIAWSKEASQQWTRRDDPERVTRSLFDWGFHEIGRTPEQWFLRDMLKQSSECFADRVVVRPVMTAGLARDFTCAFRIALGRAPHTVRLVLEKEVEIWSGGILANLTDDRFHDAEGLRREELAYLSEKRPTLADLSDRWGRDWVQFHGLRLCLLGVARLGGSDVDASA